LDLRQASKDSNHEKMAIMAVRVDIEEATAKLQRAVYKINTGPDNG